MTTRSTFKTKLEFLFESSQDINEKRKKRKNNLIRFIFH
ncbi:hypothetical protein FSS13T_11770 [Flavobacterium saliperosum S13]|uniref:Uncharacterized protein n=1 Tax=Flavobacterium saliperosum S13 TaxID=1341155 RepID=A0ABN0QHG3_9FLAO|nr:hypothetical protein FSS13T_11770 [Flavobacterium saliperosum S13]